MFKQIMARILSNTLIGNLAKVAIVSTVGLTSATTTSLIFGVLSDDKTEKDTTAINQVEDDFYIESDTAVVFNDEKLVDVKTSPSKREITNGLGDNIENYLADIVTGATKVVEGILGTNSSSLTYVDVKTGSSKQNITSILSVTPLPIEDTTTSSSIKNNASGTNLISNYDDRDDDSEEIEDQDDDRDDSDVIKDQDDDRDEDVRKEDDEDDKDIKDDEEDENEDHDDED